MTPMIFAYAVTAVLITISVMEAKTGRIANILIAVLLALFAGQAFLFPDQVNLLWQIGVAFAVLVAGFTLFVAGVFGAGAAKLSAAVALFLPIDQFGPLGLILLGAVIFAMVAFGFLRAGFGGEDSPWKSLRSRVVPMSFPIAITAICGMFVV